MHFQHAAFFVAARHSLKCPRKSPRDGAISFIAFIVFAIQSCIALKLLAKYGGICFSGRFSKNNARHIDEDISGLLFTGRAGSHQLLLMTESISSAVSSAPSLAPPQARRLPGDQFVWYVVLLEALTFCVLFGAFAFARVAHLELFNASQQRLNVSAGAINTALLLTASWCVARAVLAVREGGKTAGLLWLAAGWALGAGFVVFKLHEYADKAAEGIGLSTNLFFDFYFILTGFHLLHVLAGLLALLLVGVGLARQPKNAPSGYALETAAAFWHLVDLLWLVLFPLVYVMH